MSKRGDRISVFAERAHSPTKYRVKNNNTVSKQSTEDIGCEALDMSMNSKFGSFKRVGGSVSIDPSNM